MPVYWVATDDNHGGEPTSWAVTWAVSPLLALEQVVSMQDDVDEDESGVRWVVRKMTADHQSWCAPGPSTRQ